MHATKKQYPQIDICRSHFLKDIIKANLQKMVTFFSGNNKMKGKSYLDNIGIESTAIFDISGILNHSHFNMKK